jgi:hypothetical protein
MTILVNEQMHLSEFRPSDKCAFLDHLNDRAIDEREGFADRIKRQGDCI